MEIRYYWVKVKSVKFESVETEEIIRTATAAEFDDHIDELEKSIIELSTPFLNEDIKEDSTNTEWLRITEEEYDSGDIDFYKIDRNFD